MVHRRIGVRAVRWLALLAAVSGLVGTAGGKGPARIAEPAIIRGHTNTVLCVALSPDGQILASGGRDKTIRVWDAASRKRLALIRHTDPVTALAFAPDGRTLASGDETAAIVLWDVTPDADGKVQGRKQKAFAKDHRTAIGNLAFAPDGKTLASVASRDEAIRMWDTATGKVRATCKGHDRTPGTAVFSPDGATLASSGDDATVRLWDVTTGKEKDNFKGHDGEVWSVAFAPDGKALASGGAQDKSVTVWDAATANARATLEGHTNQVWFVAFAENGRAVVSVGRDGWVKVWDVAAGKERASFPWLGNGIYQVPNFPSFMAFSPKRNVLAVGLREDVKLWDLTPSLDPER